MSAHACRRSNGDTGFEEDVLERAPHCQVHIFDPTLSAAARAKVDALEGVAFHGYGLGGKNENVQGPCCSSRKVHRS
jgi:hypothetical protein